MWQESFLPREGRVRYRTDSEQYSFQDLFAGAGGITLGFVQAGLQAVFAVEWDKAAAATYRANFGDHLWDGDIAAIDRFPTCDIVVGGPPCQGFSQLGTRDPKDPRNSLWRHYMRAVEQSQPAIFVMENVPQLLTSVQFEAILGTARRLGYGHLAYGVLDSSKYGVPQRRKRAFVLGSKLGPIELPEPTNEVSTVRTAIGDLPPDPDGRHWHIGRNPTVLSLERYRHVPPGGNHYDLPDELKPACWRKKKSGTTDVFGRMIWDSPSCTIRTEFFKPEKGRYLHPVADRPITHREAARLQTFPDDFVFEGSKIDVAKQIGNAVPVKLAECVAKHLIAHLRDHNYLPTQAGAVQQREPGYESAPAVVGSQTTPPVALCCQVKG